MRCYLIRRESFRIGRRRQVDLQAGKALLGEHGRHGYEPMHQSALASRLHWLKASIRGMHTRY